MSKFTVNPHQWDSAEACLMHMFELHKSVHLYVSYPEKGGGRAGSYRFLTKDNLVDRIYSVHFADQSLSIDFHDMVYIHNISNRDVMNSYNCHVRITIPSTEVLKEPKFDEVEKSQLALAAQKKELEEQREALKAQEAAFKVAESKFNVLCSEDFSLESLIGHNAYIWDVGRYPFSSEHKKETLHSSSIVWFENIRHPKLISGAEANVLCDTTFFDVKADYVKFVLSSEIHDVYNYVIIELSKKC